MIFIWRVGQFTEQSAAPQLCGADVLDWGWQVKNAGSTPPSSGGISGITTTAGISRGNGITYSPGITYVPGITDIGNSSNS